MSDDKVHQLAWEYMVLRHGRPTCVVNGQAHYPTLAIVGYGKLGGRELGYGSNLDLCFYMTAGVSHSKPMAINAWITICFLPAWRNA